MSTSEVDMHCDQQVAFATWRIGIGAISDTRQSTNKQRVPYRRRLRSALLPHQFIHRAWIEKSKISLLRAAVTVHPVK